MMTFNLRQLLFCSYFSLFHLTVLAQTDSVSNGIVTSCREYSDGKVCFTNKVQRYFEDNRLVFEYKQEGIDQEENNIVMTTNFYDLFGVLIRSVVIEEDRYLCPSKTNELSNGEYFITATPYFIDPTTIPDSITELPKFCGYYSEKVTKYSPYLDVTKEVSFSDYSDTFIKIDSIFYDRYHDILRDVKYAGGELKTNSQYHYKRDNKGRIIEKRWESLDSVNGFTNITGYIYHGDRQLHSYHVGKHLGDSLESSSKTYYNKEFKKIKIESFRGSSLKSFYIYSPETGSHSSYRINEQGDSINVSKRFKKQSRNRSETWSYSTIGSSGEYSYFRVDTVKRLNRYLIREKRYRISKEQFDVQKSKMKRNTSFRRLLRSDVVETYDKYNRLIRKKSDDYHFGKEEKVYEYRKLE